MHGCVTSVSPKAVAEYDEALRCAGCGRARLQQGEQREETQRDDSLQNAC
jgi:hypothetical protein